MEEVQNNITNLNHMNLLEKIKNKEAKIGIIGLGYVGLPLLIRFCEVGFNVIGFDIDCKKVKFLNNGRSYIKYVPSEKVKDAISKGLLTATTDYSKLKEVDCIIICVPTPLKKNREPDLSYIENTSNHIATCLRKNQAISLESTTYPGTTREILLPKFEKKGLKVGRDFYLIYSPEREDPGNPVYNTKNIPKVVGGITNKCTKLGQALYSHIIDKIVTVSSVEIAEFTKLLENIFRAVNIALVNELKVLSHKMGIDIWEVIDASSTKPFGFMPFYPGPGLGGHCIPIDPYYLSWKAKEYDFETRFIELAGEINTNMPDYVISKICDGLNKHRKCLNGSRILVLGVAYKKDTDDIRESPGIKIINILKNNNALVEYHDPYVKSFSGLRHYPNLTMRSISLNEKNIKNYDCVVIITDHSSLDYKWIVENSTLVIDTRNATKGIKSNKIIKA
jgi:UDP-N-acetyl-D-glucosamine dehydrogenase